MKIRTVIHFCCAALVMFAWGALQQQAFADELSRQKIGEWGDPLTPPQSRTDCIGYASGKFPWGGGWKTCNQWATHWRHMEVEYFLVLNGPLNLGEEMKNAALQCLVVAAGAAGTTAAATSGAAAPAAVAAAKVAFGACIATKGSDLVDKYSLSGDSRSHWTDWS